MTVNKKTLEGFSRSATTQAKVKAKIYNNDNGVDSYLLTPVSYSWYFFPGKGGELKKDLIHAV